MPGADTSNDIYLKLVKVTDVYLGPSAERFIARQIRNHLNKEPNELTRSDISILIDWIRITVSLLTDNSEIVEEYISQVEDIAMNRKNVVKEGTA